MSISASFLPEFDHEAANTRRVLERIPDDKFDWRPHTKSHTLGQLAGHLAEIPKWTSTTLEEPELDFGGNGENYIPPAPTSRAEVLAEFDANVAAARKAIANVSDETLMQSWTLRAGDNIIFTMPRAAVLRGFIMSHTIHHRAQLGVYLRLNDIPVPAVYGPTADEQTM